MGYSEENCYYTKSAELLVFVSELFLFFLCLSVLFRLTPLCEVSGQFVKSYGTFFVGSNEIFNIFNHFCQNQFSINNASSITPIHQIYLFHIYLLQIHHSMRIIVIGLEWKITKRKRKITLKNRVLDDHHISL